MTSVDLEIDILLHAIKKVSDFDFSNYARPHILRRLDYRRKTNHFNSISDMIAPVINDNSFREMLLKDLSINVTEMFRDPDFFKSVKMNIYPQLVDKKNLYIWHAGCSSGEEVYSNAIFLEEELPDSEYQIIGTDFNKIKLATANNAVYPISKIKEYTINYQKAGGKHSFSDYYSAHYKEAQLNSNIKKRISFSFHNLVSDPFYNSIDVIFCRNVLIYFNKKLQNQVLSKFLKSLKPKGFLCLGDKETLQFSEVENNFEIVDHENRIYRKI